eukprot:Unigene11307_Nuclearia_a/m.34547 Unigene11307_Nuclearia_a/g.34547  ORF Unigene11307_Nuclearia_a/g.34547 Unigene11307_Nuclearia_a/m.34547 type:complete len:633 (-) Unigene11307_Nuclearia_a:108-2006(-)
MGDGGVKIVYGRDVRAVPALLAVVRETLSSKYDFCVVPLVHPRHARDRLHHHDVRRAMPLTRSDRVLPSAEWTTVVVGRLSRSIELDSPLLDVRRNSEKVFAEEIAWAAHLGVPALEFPAPTAEPVNYAMNLAAGVAVLQQCQVWVRVPLLAKRVRAEGTATAMATGHAAPRVDTWDSWNKLRLLCDHHAKLAVALELTKELPDEAVQARWISEPVKAVYVPTSIFATNKAGFPVLPKAHQKFIKMLMRVTQHVVITGRLEHTSARAEDGTTGILLYRQYLEYLQGSLEQDSAVTRGYNDYLQFPLQPLADNLESAVYEIFEQDPIKYKLYEEAVLRALRARHADAITRQGEPVTLMVVGAGRGPLVNAALRAADTARCPIKVYAVEKNPNAIVTLQNMVDDTWHERVTVVASDMRVWQPPAQADILVSELLGSFGDNELSPECLDGAQRLLKPGGISIPYDSTSYIVPVSSAKVYNDVASFNDLKHFETPFVVKLTACWLVSPIAPLFKFEHPNHRVDLAGEPDNSRYATVTFTVSVGALVHGIAGYFESRLFEELQLSIHPATHSPGMFSWFPIFFPLRTPLYARAGTAVEATFWRRVSPRKVWYEWAVRVDGRLSPVHNPGGRSYSIGL